MEKERGLTRENISRVTVYEIPTDAHGEPDCMSCQHYYGGVADLPFCRLGKVSVYFCSDYVPLGKDDPNNDRVVYC